VSTSKALIAVLVWSSLTVLPLSVIAQEKVAPASSAVATDTNECVQPEPVVPISDIDGRFEKAAGFLTRRIEIKTVHNSRSVNSQAVCRLGAREKFDMFVRDGSEPLTFVTAAFEGGWAFVNNNDAGFGRGSSGYGKRWAAALADSASGNFLGTFLYPSLFREDPRFYRQLNGSRRWRLGHAVAHVFIARADSGASAPNYSELFTIASSATLQNMYHPGNRRGFGPVTARAGVAVATDMGNDVVREFWPDITRRLRLPFLRHGSTTRGSAAHEGVH
jgi:hypothetical protein